ncbi:CoA transferase [Sphingomonas sp. MG17]|uniref:CoA transferase n=1 Tax=Sphingomonas tagetis TaxID=2949092 RepID=A0A9X2HPT1_9SPHN|nr:CaiB/BaiF CoA-transferase family protein [Sphingomonas tagetis]MCP3730310.1 CoA transferase [Sphingomonas tagetis]
MGPLKGIKIVEIGGVGPGPFGCMLLGDMGAEIVRIDKVVDDFRIDGDMDQAFNVWSRGRKSIRLDLRTPEGVEVVTRMIRDADAVVEGFRPGVMERLGLGPDDCLAMNPRLVYGRITGWGQSGPLATAAGHDINYIALSGALDAIGPPGEPPVPPLNLVGDLGGGGMLLAYGVVCALVERMTSGKGQVIDAAMIDGIGALMALFHGLQAAGQWSDRRGDNMIDGGTPWYGVYETADGRHVTIGALEPKFYARLMELLELTGEKALPPRADRTNWPAIRERLTAVFRTRTRDQWCRLLEGTDTCFAPVLTMAEAAAHPHCVDRDMFVRLDGVVQPRPAPRFSRSGHGALKPPPRLGSDTDTILQTLGYTAAEASALRERGAVA